MTDWGDLPEAPGPMGGDGNGGGNLPTVQAGGIATQVSLGERLEIRRAALQLPRDPGTVRRTIEQMAEWSGDSWEYEFPIDGKLVSGPSIKCTNAVARAWGNCGIMTSNVQDIGDAWIIYSTFVDHQTGFDLTRGFRQRKRQRTLKTDAGRAEDIVFQIGVSKSARNVVRNALGDVVDEAIRYARRRMTKAIEQRPDEYKTRIKSRLESIGYPLVKVEAWAAGAIDKWAAPMIAQVVRILTAHSEGALDDLDTIFAPKGVDVEGKSNGAAKDQPAPSGEASTKAKPQTSTEAPASPGGPTAAREPARKPGRPKKPETLAREQAARANNIIAEIRSTDPEYVNDYLAECAAEIAELSMPWQNEIREAARKHVASEPDPAPYDYDPETGEIEPLSADPDDSALLDQDEQADDDGYERWLQDMSAAMATERREFLLGRKNQFLRTQPYGERGAAAVEAAFAARGESSQA